MKRSSLIHVLTIIAVTATPLFAQPKPDKERFRVVVGDTVRVLREGDGPAVVLAEPGGAYLGVSTTNLTSDLRSWLGTAADAGVLVARIYDDSAAQRAGLRVGDVIVAIDGRKVASTWDVSRALRDRKKGDQVRIDVVRNQAPIQIVATLDERTGATTWSFDPGELPIRRELVERALEAIPRSLDGTDVRAFRFTSDCDEVRERLRLLESRLKDLEKKMK